MTDRDDVYGAIWGALVPFGLHHYTDGVMDSLDTVIEWDEQEEDNDGEEW